VGGSASPVRYTAHRAGTLRRLADGERRGNERAEALIAAWAAEAAARGLGSEDPRYWSEGCAWLVERTK
jgi:hypothetical protein